MKKKKIILAFLLVLAITLGMDWMESKNLSEEITRQETGREEETLQYILNAEDVLENYNYDLNIESIKVTKEEAEVYFQEAIQEIEESFYALGSSRDSVTEDVTMLESYQQELVSAVWSLDNYEVIDTEGKLVEEALVPEGTLVNASVELTCGSYGQVYTFAFVVYPREKSAQEELLEKIEDNLQKQMEVEGNDKIYLPKEVDGISLSWEGKKSNYTIKALVFGFLILVLLSLSKKEKAQKEVKFRKQQMELEYPEIVSKILILLGSGMSFYQVWNRISTQYLDKRNKKKGYFHPAYEEILRTMREIEDGESERKAMENFGKRTKVRCYHRLSQLLIQSIEKGVWGIYEQLEREAEDSFRERKQTAQKLGEEAGTKLLLPMIMMLAVVMAIVMVPAFLKL